MPHHENLDEVFESHRARRVLGTGGVELVEWRKPGSGRYAMWFSRAYGTLTVFGDCGCFVYQFHPDDVRTLAEIADCELDYFAGKCVASEVGAGAWVWDDDKAEAALQGYFAGVDLGEGDEGREEELRRRKDEEEEFGNADGWEALVARERWILWCENCAWEIFGSGWEERSVLRRPGVVRDVRIELHWRALRLAVEDLHAEERAP